MLTVVFDAGSLITACKFEVEGRRVIDHLLPGVQVIISSKVKEEVAVSGARYPDGMAAGERIARGDIQVQSLITPKWSQYLTEYTMGQGELESIELCGQLTVDALITDDYLAFVASTRLGLRTWMFPDLVVEAANIHAFSPAVARAILNVIRPRYRKGVIAHRLARL